MSSTAFNQVAILQVDGLRQVWNKIAFLRFGSVPEDKFWRNQDITGTAYQNCDEVVFCAILALECYQNHNGKHYYAGYKNVTQSGRPCWPWKDQGPFDNNFIGFDYIFDYNDITKAKNYCRMFLDEEGFYKPWCYNANYDSVTDPLRWDNCSIPQCYDTY
ncbi:receptor protein-tyrosine kinase [Elysia marginata]|uniref:Receptor protein-tyrosine kinase n=1 Tax=Elysia marginata TaxID=1093978 RepID=A0AAV4HBH6_9GAST|nr:receptor protein-tyrosine kinase [Elysia marginata]